MFIEWSDDLKIGIESIDEEHRLLILEFEKLYTLMRQGKGHSFFEELLDFLEMYIEKHIVNEEEIQRIIGYDQQEEHKMVHQMFREKVNSIVEEHKGKAVTDHDLLEINRFLHNWLSNHILVEDMKIGEFYSNLSEEEKTRIEGEIAGDSAEVPEAEEAIEVEEEPEVEDEISE